MYVRFEDFPDASSPGNHESALNRAARLDDGRDESLHYYGQRVASGASAQRAVEGDP